MNSWSPISNLPPPAPHVGMDNITQGHLDGLMSQIKQIRRGMTADRRAYTACWCRALLNRTSLIYLILARFTRTRILTVVGFRWAVVALGTTLTWAAFTVISLSLVVGSLAAPMGAIFFTCLLFLPGDDKLTAEISIRKLAAAELVTQRTRLRKSIAQTKVTLAAMQSRYGQWEAWLKERLYRESVQRRRQELAESDWKSLQGNAFQHFLAEAFRLLYYEVEETGQAGDHGVDLIAKRQGNRIAVQVKGYASGNSVDNKAVQEAYSGKDIWQCHACAVITNSRYTRQATEDAARLGCVMIDELTLRALIVGQRDLWQECVAARPVGLQPLPNRNC
jgi:restriction system protein